MLFLTLFPNVMPSSLNADWSLTVTNASSSPYTLKIMTWCAAIATPLVLLYQGWTYWVFRKRIGTQHIAERALSPPGTCFTRTRPLERMFHVKPIDPRLLRYARATRRLPGRRSVAARAGRGGAGRRPGDARSPRWWSAPSSTGCRSPNSRTPLLLLAAVAVGRALVSWLTELAAHRASAAVKSELRGRLLERAAALGPGWLSGQRTGVAGRARHPGRRRPRRLLLALSAAAGARGGGAGGGAGADRHRGLGLGGDHRRHAAADPGLHGADRLGHPVPDGPPVAAAVPAVGALPRRGRRAAHAEGLRPGQGAGRVDPRRSPREYRQATLRTLRIAFLSSFALELLATLSVALVAVDHRHAARARRAGPVHRVWWCSILAPEAYLPIRQVGAQYHAAAEGLAAAEEIFEVLETPCRGPAVRGTAPGARRLELRRGDRPLSRAVSGRRRSDAAFTVVEPGETVALVGPSGVGQVDAAERRCWGSWSPTAGRVRVGGRRPRRAGPGAVARADRLGAAAAASVRRDDRRERTAGPAGRRRRGGAAGARATPARWSSSTRCPRAPTRCSARTAPGSPPGSGNGSRWPGRSSRTGRVLLLDEPTAALDGETEAEVVDGGTAAGRRAGRCCWSSTGRRCWRWRTGWCGWRQAGGAAHRPDSVARPDAGSAGGDGLAAAPARRDGEPRLDERRAVPGARLGARRARPGAGHAGARRGRLALALLLGQPRARQRRRAHGHLRVADLAGLRSSRRCST